MTAESRIGDVILQRYGRQTLDKIAEMWRGGMRGRDVADELNIGRRELHRILQTMRSMHEYGVDAVPHRARDTASWQPPVLDGARGHRGRWSRTISHARLRAHIAADLEENGATKACAKIVRTQSCHVSRALSEHYDDDHATTIFDRVAAVYGYVPVPTTPGMYVGMSVESMMEAAA